MTTKPMSRKEWYKVAPIVTLMIMLSASATWAQNLPSSADPSRIEPFASSPVPTQPPSKIIVPEAQSTPQIPENAKDITFTLTQLDIHGATLFSSKQLKKLYQSYVNKEIPLSHLWKIAEQITQLYQQKGYFLCRAYVPAQEIDDGKVTLEVVEGSITEVTIEDSALTEYTLVDALIERLKQQKPISAYQLESFMLQMNALPGVEFRAFVEPAQGKEAGMTRLSLRPTTKKGTGSVSVDNFGSRFLGPYQTTATYHDSFIPLQQTTLSAMSSIPSDELRFIAFRHATPIYPDWQIELAGHYVDATPGASLAPNDIQSNALELGIGISWQPIRQRQENLTTSLELTGQNSNGDIFGDNPLTRDRIRAARLFLHYDTADAWSGYNYLSLTVNQGISILGANAQQDSHLSRAEADPTFTSMQFNYMRQQAMMSEFMAISQFASQIASGSLYAAEEFGFGGQAFGRAYDPSEMTGDHGVAASFELRYLGFAPQQDITFAPYGFYDIGKVWNEEAGGIDELGMSAGFGLRLDHPTGLAGNLGLAWPLDHAISNPIYGNGKNPRLLMQMSYGF